MSHSASSSFTTPVPPAASLDGAANNCNGDGNERKRKRVRVSSDGPLSYRRTSHATASERDKQITAVPAEGLPDGWLVRHFPRLNQSNGNARSDSSYYSPKLGFKFRSRKEALRFIHEVVAAEGDEAAAIKEFRGGKKKTVRSMDNTTNNAAIKPAAGSRKKPSLEVAAASGCTKCQDELKAGEKTTKEHLHKCCSGCTNDNCKNRRGDFNERAVDGDDSSDNASLNNLQLLPQPKAASTKNDQNEKPNEVAVGGKRGAPQLASSASSNSEPRTVSSGDLGPEEQSVLEVMRKMMAPQRALADENQTLRAKLADMQTQLDQKHATIEKLHANIKDAKGDLEQTIKAHCDAILRHSKSNKNKGRAISFHPSNNALLASVDALFLKFEDTDQSAIFSSVLDSVGLYFGGWHEAGSREWYAKAEADRSIMDLVKQRIRTLMNEKNSKDFDNVDEHEVNRLILLNGHILSDQRQRYEMMVDKHRSVSTAMRRSISELEDRNRSIESEKNAMQASIDNMQNKLSQKDAIIEKLHANMKGIKVSLKQNIEDHCAVILENDENNKNNAKKMRWYESNRDLMTAIDALFLKFDINHHAIDQSDIFPRLVSQIRLYMGGLEDIADEDIMDVIKQRLHTLMREKDYNASSDGDEAEVKRLIALNESIISDLSEALQTRISDLEERNQFLDAKCGSYQRRLKRTENNDWLSNENDIDIDHLVSMGFDHNYIQNMESFLHTLEGEKCKLLSGRPKSIHLTSLDPHEVMIWHDRTLLIPRWREFADVLQTYQHQNEDDSFDILIKNIQLVPGVLDMLAPALREKNIENFKLVRNGFSFISTNDGIDFAIQVLRHNAASLRAFTWESNPIYSLERANKLLDELKSLPHLDSIQLNSCNSEQLMGYYILYSLIRKCTNLKVISFGSNHAHTGGETHLPDFIATNPPLQSLHLNNNCFNDRDVILISNALTQNTNLKHLNLKNNVITDVGCIALADALCQNSTLRFLDVSENRPVFVDKITRVGTDALKNAVFSRSGLNSVADSNHTCRIEGINLGFGNRESLSRPANRKNKIYYLLSLRHESGSNVSILDHELEDAEDTSLKLVPHILQIPSRFRMSYSLENASAKPPLSIMYEFVRNFKIVQLFNLKDTESHWQAAEANTRTLEMTTK